MRLLRGSVQHEQSWLIADFTSRLLVGVTEWFGGLTPSGRER
jgi:hypothetical protein